MPRALYFKLSVKLIIILALFLFSKNLISELADSNARAASPDAIAIRVMSNLEHLSPFGWYQKNIKIKGAPQNLRVDGYEAVRDGRTVYVNAANVAASSLYTNIHIISYNQEAEEETADIFGQILKHWKFNNNVNQETGVCNVAGDKACVADSDCPKNQYCLSKKARIVRDTKRLADLSDIKQALNNYQQSHNGFFPDLIAGSYLSGHTISVWPSWQSSLGSALGATMPTDPINKLTGCSGNFDPKTCWNERDKKFAGPIVNGALALPSNSRAYVYNLKTNGSYNICAVMESGYITGEEGACPDSDVLAGYGDIARSSAITINCGTLRGAEGKPFEGYVSVNYSGKDILSWKLRNDYGNWIDSLELTKTALPPKQKKISAVKAGTAAAYWVDINVKSSFGAETVQGTGCQIIINKCLAGIKPNGECQIPGSPSCAVNSGQPCASSPNNCGQVNSGYYNCEGVCSETSPANLSIACSNNSNCDDKNDCTVDTCNNPGQCASSCSYTAITSGSCGGASCVPDKPNCAANTCAGSTCNNGCANIAGTKNFCDAISYSVGHGAVVADCSNQSLPGNTTKGETITRPCPAGFTGKVIATCNSSCGWSIDTSGCSYIEGGGCPDSYISKNGPSGLVIPQIDANNKPLLSCQNSNTNLGDFPCDPASYRTGKINIFCNSSGSWAYTHTCQ